MRDFTLATYRHLLAAFSEAGYRFVTFRDYILDAPDNGHRVVILRHDVDRRPSKAVEMAELEYKLGAKASYFFRIVPESFSEIHISRIAEMGHEIGYHYEDLTLARGNVDAAIARFEENLELFRSIQPVSTISMHGSPLTKWDNCRIWDHADYRSYGIIGEPYLDLDFEKVLYLTDTGRAWNSDRYSRRDRVSVANRPIGDIRFANSRSLAEYIRAGELPAEVMLNTHPQRWSDNLYEWGREWLSQNLKNPLKYALLRFSGND